MTALTRSPTALAGFRFDRTESLDGIQSFGEEWLPGRVDIGWHAHRAWEAYLQLAGTSVWEDRQGRREILPGHGYLVAPGVEHRLVRVEQRQHHFQFTIIDLPMILQRNRPDYSALAAGILNGVGFHVGEATALDPALALLAASCARTGKHRQALMETAATALAVGLVDWVSTPPGTLRAEHPAIEEVRRRITADPGRRWRLADLTAGTGCSAKHLCTIFGKSVGQTPHRYLLTVRLERLRSALGHSDWGLAQLAAEFGFAFSQHLSRVFTAHFGVTPSRYRASIRE